MSAGQYPLQRNQQPYVVMPDGLTYSWDTYTGRYLNTKRLSYEEQHPRQPDQLGLPPVPPKQEWALPVVPGPGQGNNPPAPPPPDPFAGWNSHDPNTRSWRYIDPDSKYNYDTKYSPQAYQQYITDSFGSRQTPLLDYAKGRYDDFMSQYLKVNEQDPTGETMWTDYLTPEHAQQIRQGFALGSPASKGYSLAYMPAGRSTF